MSASNQSHMLNELGFQLLKASHTDDNATISPLAILKNLNYALQASSCDKVVEQIHHVLHLQTSDKDKNVKSISELIKSIVHGDSEYVTINMACGICQAPTVDCSKYAQLENIIFSKGKDSAIAANAQVIKLTENRIKNLLTSAHEPAHGITIFSAMELKAPYCHIFTPDATEIKDFHLSSTKSIKIPTMKHGSMIMYNDDKDIGVRMMVHSFNGCNFDIVIMVPIKKFGLAEMEKKLTAEKYLHLLTNMRSVLGTLEIPKMSFDHHSVLKKSFESLGLNMNNPPCVVDNFVHGVSMNLNEFGSNVPKRELRESEMYGMCLGGFIEPPEEQTILANEPFLVAVNYSKTNSMVLLSRVLHPANAVEH